MTTNELTVTTKELSEEEYADFFRCLNNLREICNDVDIRDGIVRQRSNDLTAIFELDMTSLLGNLNLPISNLNKKMDLLKTFFGQAVTIEVTEGANETESSFIVSDSQSSVKFLFPSLDFLDNKYLTEEELNSIFNLEEDDMFLHCNMTSLMTERIKLVTTNFNTQALKIELENDIATITASTQSKDQVAKFQTEIPLNINFNGKYFSNVSTIPFSIEHENNQLDFNMYKDPQQNISLNRIKTQLGPVDINIYSRSSIMSDEDN